MLSVQCQSLNVTSPPLVTNAEPSNRSAPSASAARAKRGAPRQGYLSAPHGHFGGHYAVAERYRHDVFTRADIRGNIVVIVIHDVFGIAAVRGEITFGNAPAVYKQLVNAKPANGDFEQRGQFIYIERMPEKGRGNMPAQSTYATVPAEKLI